MPADIHQLHQNLSRHTPLICIQKSSPSWYHKALNHLTVVSDIGGVLMLFCSPLALYQLLGDSSPDMTTHAPSGAVLHKILKLRK